MLVAGIGWMTHTLWLLVAALVGMGVHSTLFGPVKYAYLPQKLKPEELVGGNGVIEMGTFVGILLGEVVGALLVAQKPFGIELVAGGTLLVRGHRAAGQLPHPAVAGARADAEDQLRTRSPNRCATWRSRARTARCSCRCSATRGSGSTAR